MRMIVVATVTFIVGLLFGALAVVVLLQDNKRR